MSRTRYLPPRLLVMVAAFGMASAASSLPAQVGMPGQGIKLKEPVASRVYQRDANGRAEIPIVLGRIGRQGDRRHRQRPERGIR